MTIFEHKIWKYLAPYAQMTDGRDNVDLLQLPDSLRALALETVVNCVACGALIHPLRARVKSGRSRIAGKELEHRLFYAATCPAEEKPGCSRTNAAKEHKDLVKRMLSKGST